MQRSIVTLIGSALFCSTLSSFAIADSNYYCQGSTLKIINNTDKALTVQDIQKVSFGLERFYTSYIPSNGYIDGIAEQDIIEPHTTRNITVSVDEQSAGDAFGKITFLADHYGVELEYSFSQNRWDSYCYGQAKIVSELGPSIKSSAFASNGVPAQARLELKNTG